MLSLLPSLGQVSRPESGPMWSYPLLENEVLKTPCLQGCVRLTTSFLECSSSISRLRGRDEREGHASSRPLFVSILLVRRLYCVLFLIFEIAATLGNASWGLGGGTGRYFVVSFRSSRSTAASPPENLMIARGRKFITAARLSRKQRCLVPLSSPSIALCTFLSTNRLQ